MASKSQRCPGCGRMVEGIEKENNWENTGKRAVQGYSGGGFLGGVLGAGLGALEDVFSSSYSFRCRNCGTTWED